MSIGKFLNERNGPPQWTSGYNPLERKSTKPRRSRTWGSIGSAVIRCHKTPTLTKLGSVRTQPPVPTITSTSPWMSTLPTPPSRSKNSRMRSVPSIRLKGGVLGAVLKGTWLVTAPKTLTHSIERTRTNTNPLMSPSPLLPLSPSPPPHPLLPPLPSPCLSRPSSRSPSRSVLLRNA
jgi:hypothetical protein